MAERIVVIVQARVGSTRLPGKTLRVLHKYPLIAHVIHRAQATGFETWLATSLADADTPLAAVGRQLGAEVYRGSEWDVLQRFAGAAAAARADVVVRMTADCPLWAPELARSLVSDFLETDRSGILTNDTTCSGWPDGLDVEVFSGATLQLAAAQAGLTGVKRLSAAERQADREHVTPWIRRRGPHWIIGAPEDWRCAAGSPDHCEGLRHPIAARAHARGCAKLSIDTIDDFHRVARIVAAIPEGDFSWSATRAALLRLQEAS